MSQELAYPDYYQPPNMRRKRVWPLFLVDSNRYTFRRTAYDAEKAAIEIKSRYPEAKVFAQENVRTIPTETASMEMIEKMARETK
ncbi:hypothetical protein ACFO4N_12355 [Camelliibacillus cellulosilyticus]|uniref:Uncharacterized protein n=1 Tax=Camelliibacillus cellulosilyticus TaxID=2174486 RepID=A0ABV9GQP2_9BACL